jgi:hypothetical protein
MKNIPIALPMLRPNGNISQLVLLAGMLASTIVEAANVTITYTGLLDSVDEGISSYFSPGDEFEGVVTYSTTEYNGMMDESTYADLVRSRGSYDVITEFTLSVGDFHFSISNVGFVDIYNEGTILYPPYVNDRMFFSLGNYVTQAQYEISPSLWNFIDETDGPLGNNLHMDDVYIQLQDLTNSLFDDVSLPITFPGLDAFTDTLMLASFYENGGGYGLSPPVGSIKGTIISMEVSQVPLPAAAWLFGTGLIGLIGIVRRKIS